MKQDAKAEGQKQYDEFWARQMADPEFRAIYEKEAAKKERWLKRMEARQARVEKEETATPDDSDLTTS